MSSETESVVRAVMTIGVFAVIALVIGGVVLLLVRELTANKRRETANTAFAQARGWTYTPVWPALADFARSHPFGGSNNCTAVEVGSGTHRSRWAAIFTVHTWTHSSPPSQKHDQVVALVVETPIGPLSFIPRSSLKGALAGPGDVAVESVHFARQWAVTCDDERVAHAVLAPHVVEALMHPALASWRVTIEPGRVFATRPGDAQFAPCLAVLDALCDVVDRIPAGVLEG